MFNRKVTEERIKVENAYEWMKWCSEIPRLKFKDDWEVKIMPPVGGAIIRFNCMKGDKFADVYLDCYSELGLVPYPYWEIYPYNNDVYRCGINDTDSLLSVIDEILEGKDNL